MKKCFKCSADCVVEVSTDIDLPPFYCSNECWITRSGR